MAMKFWFGKKGLDATSFNAAGQSAIDEAAEMAVADVAVADDRSEDDAVGGDASLQIDGTALLAVQPIEEETEPVVAALKAAPATLKRDDSTTPALRLTSRIPEVAAATSSETAPASEAVSETAPKSETVPKVVLEERRPTFTLKAVSGKLQSTSTSAPAPTLRAVSEKSQSVPAAASEAAASKPTFSLRMKTKAAAPAAGAATPSPPISAAPAEPADAQQGGAAASTSAPSEWVRPKPDQRALYYQLMDGLYDAILILDDRGHVVDVSRRVTEVLGYSREETWDMSIEKVIPGMSRQMFEHLRRNLKDNHQILIDARCFRKDGTSFAGEVGVSTLALTRASNMVFAIRNVERRKNAMDEMRRGQAAFELSFSPCFVCDIDGFFQVVNPALLEAFGIPDVRQAKRVRFVDLLPDAASLFLRAVCGDKVRETVNVSVADGMSVALELALAPLKNGQQTVTGVAGSMRQPG